MKQIRIILLLIFLFACSLLNAQDFYNSTNLLVPTYSFLGTVPTGRIGYYLCSAGDVNNDGYGDFLIASYHNNLHGWNSGAAYLMLGRKDIDWTLNSSVDVADAVLRGKHEYDLAAYNIAGEGDFNGDGFDDLLIGAPGNWDRKPTIIGSVYIVFGKENIDWGDDFVLEDYADKIIVGENDLDQFGYAVAFAGDVNQDGCDDILCSAPFRNHTDEWDGKVYLILGSKDDERQRLNAAEEAAASFIYPSYRGTLGSAVTGVKDVNQDGYVDFLIGAPGIGTTFLILGKSNLDWGQNFDLNNADCKFLPETKYDDGGWQVKSAGDVNSDGYPDFLISGLQIKFDAGKVYLILGRENWPFEGIQLSQADASYLGEGNPHHAGVSINGIEDFDGDGFDDFIIGARYYKQNKMNMNSYHRGKAYIIQGKHSGWERDVSLKNIDYYFIGEDTINCAGWGVSSAGDDNGDYRNDIVISAPFSSESDTWAGEIYLFLGDFPLSQLGGRTVYYTNDCPVPNVTLELAGDQNGTQISDSDGQYLFNIPSGDNYTVTPAKQAFTGIAENCISIYDAALTAFHAVFLDTLDTLAQIAADVNLDGQVTMYDASLIAYFSVNFPNEPESHVGEWKFDPESYHYNKSDLSSFNQDFSCTLLGEVSGNWKPDTNQIILAKKILQDIQACSRATVTVPISIDSNLSMVSAEIQLTFDAELLEFAGIDKTELTHDFQLFYNESNPGRLLIGLFGLSAVEQAGEIVTINFKLINNSKEESSIILEKFKLNDYKPLQAELVLKFSSSDIARNEPDYRLLQNYPNPFNPETVIKYKLEKPAAVTLTIIDLMGRVVKTLESGFKKQGTYKVTWNGTDNAGNDVSSGIYLCNLKCGKKLYKRKMLKVK